MNFFRFFIGYLLQVMPFSILCIAPLSDAFGLHKNRRFLYLFLSETFLSVIFSLVCMQIEAAFPVSHLRLNLSNLCFLLTLIPLLLLFSFLNHSAWYRKLFFFSFSMLGALCTTSLANFLFALLRGSNFYEDYMPYSFLGSTCVLAVTAIVLPILLIAETRVNQIMINSFSIDSYIHMSLLSIILFIILGSGLIFIDYMYVKNPMTIFLYICVYVLAFSIYFIYIRIIQETTKRINAQNQARKIQNQMDMARGHYQWIAEMSEYSRKIQHDFRHHMIVLDGMLKLKEYGQASEYINEYLQSAAAFSPARFSSNEVINILLNYYRFTCKRKQIDFRLQSIKKDLTPPSGCTDIQHSDLSVVLGNLLENAMTAASKLPSDQAYIRVGIYTQGNFLILLVDNSFDGITHFRSGEYESTKSNHVATGLKSISAIAEKYYGGTEFRHEADAFHASVMLQYPPALIPAK